MANPTHNRSAQDPLLTRLGVAKALRSLAAITADVHEWDAALNWCVAQGFVVPGHQRDEIVLTKRGAAVVWLFWRAYSAARTADRGGNVDLTEWLGPQGEGEAIIE